MMRALSLHIKQAFLNKISLTLLFSWLILVSIYHYFYILKYLGEVPDELLATAYKWIGFRDDEMDVYLLLMPVLAALPFSTSYNSDKADKFKSFVSKEVPFFPYVCTKYIVTFLIGGLLYILPFVFSLLFCKLTIQDGVPTPALGIIKDNSMFASLYFSSPITYISLYIGINFLFAGLMAVLGLSASIWSRKDYMAILFPFAITSLPYVVLNIVFPTIGGAPIHLYDPKQPLQGMSPYILIMQCTLFFGISLFMYMKGVQKDRKKYMRRLQKRMRCKKSIQKSVSM
ncbi:hypothetical protein [Bacillus pseudomycoides]|uniref:Uncharacterized protein n=1 Tax=Bacillus pseudomycoides TaxID=64104 RepID=A0A2B5UKA7_9BACI|nr:hypothetical protein [Bacillus pseudomycoides]PDY45909.1 hypothetical protein CON79_17750 [Bacillus pseudomycoides]PEA81579.1 hypothetical protein CON99_21835 [Bacillus pseudomycoides]PED05736.1 hypothetical protein COO19_24895 [Bacillus pseudomycoides]PED70630.1 hypothetical protein CON97_18440 [Bacillus pseudomycoides]PEI37406.1 hypothetical protein CN620_22470 [Bacillus pseudomycoides]